MPETSGQQTTGWLVYTKSLEIIVFETYDLAARRGQEEGYEPQAVTLVLEGERCDTI